MLFTDLIGKGKRVAELRRQMVCVLPAQLCEQTDVCKHHFEKTTGSRATRLQPAQDIEQVAAPAAAGPLPEYAPVQLL